MCHVHRHRMTERSKATHSQTHRFSAADWNSGTKYVTISRPCVCDEDDGTCGEHQTQTESKKKSRNPEIFENRTNSEVANLILLGYCC